MGNTGSKKRKDWLATKQYSTDVEPTQRRSVSPFKRSKSAAPGDLCPSQSDEVPDVPQKPGKAIVTLTNLQSDKPSGSCVTDSIYLDWTPPKEDGGRPILGYSVEMYDLPTGNWVSVTQTEGRRCRSMLDNILCGIMYRFRVRAFNEIGSSVPGIPSDAFVIDTPGVHIAPYFIVCPPPEVSKFSHETVQFRAKALGTPTPNILWQKDNEPIFITQGIDISNEPDGSMLTVHNLQLDDEGLIECVAVNHVGKATASTVLHVNTPPNFHTNNIPLKFSFRHDDMIRLKFPIEAQPAPDVTLLKNGDPVDSSHCQALYRDNTLLVKIDSSQECDTGLYHVEATNEFGVASLDFNLTVEVPPEAPSTPDILDVAPTGELTLAWQPPSNCCVDHYIVEYYRDQWQLWLRMKTCMDSVTVIQDLIPGSKYKFRVMAASVTGISEPSPESEEIMIGKLAEDELFDLPRGRPFLKKTRKVPSFERSSLDRSTAGVSGQPGRRHVSLDREVYYDANNIRRDVVGYKPSEKLSAGGTDLSQLGKFSNKMSSEDLVKYRTSMTGLCNRIKAMSNSSIGSRGSKISLDTATKPLQMEITNQARKSNSMGQLWTTPYTPHIDSDQAELLHQHAASPASYTSPTSASTLCISSNRRSCERNPSEPPVSRLESRIESSSSISDCKKSLTDIRDRIGSLQSLLKTSRNLTSSTAKQRFFSDLPTFNVPDLDLDKRTRPSEACTANANFNRNDSYANAIGVDPVVEDSKETLETHFPYNPDLVSLGSLECDKFPQEQTETKIELIVDESNTDEVESSDMIDQTVSNFLRNSMSPTRWDRSSLTPNDPYSQDCSNITHTDLSPHDRSSHTPTDQYPQSHQELEHDSNESTDKCESPYKSVNTHADIHQEDCSSYNVHQEGSLSSTTLREGSVSSATMREGSISSATLDERSVSSCSDRTMLVSNSMEEYALSESTQTLQQRSTSALSAVSASSQGTLIADETSSLNSNDEDP